MGTCAACVLLGDENMNNKYIDAFFECVTWQFKKSDIMLVEKEENSYSDLFVETFPKVSGLLKKAITFRIVLLNDSCFRLLCWENGDSIGGWLCKKCEYISTEFPHLNLLKMYIGTIVESWGFEDVRDDLICNMNGVLIDNITYGIGEWQEYFKESCEAEELFPEIQDEKSILIAEEANGNLTLVNKDNGEIVLFAPDHCFYDVYVYPDCPNYTFYKIDNVDDLTDYFELVAQQWMGYL